MTSKIWLPKEGMCLEIGVIEDEEVTVNRESVREFVARQRERYQEAEKDREGEDTGRGGGRSYQRMLQNRSLVVVRRAVLERLYLCLNPLWLSGVHGILSRRRPADAQHELVAALLGAPRRRLR